MKGGAHPLAPLAYFRRSITRITVNNGVLLGLTFFATKAGKEHANQAANSRVKAAAGNSLQPLAF